MLVASGLDPARRILQARDRRLRRQRLPALGTAADGELHQRIMPHPVEVVAVLAAAGDERGARRHQLEHLVLDTGLIPVVGHGLGEAFAHAVTALRLTQEDEAGVRGLVAAVEIDCELPGSDGWKIEGEECRFGQRGCGVGVARFAIVFANELLRRLNALHHTRRATLTAAMNNPG